MKRTNKRTSNMVYTSIEHIPIGQAIIMEDGEYGLRLKKDKMTYEEIPIGELVSKIAKTASDSNILE